MSDPSLGDSAYKARVKNPLLSPAVTGLWLEDLSQSAVILPVSSEQKPLEKQDNNESSSPPPKEEDASEPAAPPSQQDDDFDINAYFERLKCTGYVSAPMGSTTALTTPAPHLASEENLVEVNLNETSDNVQTSLTTDIAQNFSQLPQVLPQVASAVFSSFSNMLSPYTSRNTTIDNTPAFDTHPPAQNTWNPPSVQGTSQAAHSQSSWSNQTSSNMNQIGWSNQTTVFNPAQVGGGDVKAGQAFNPYSGIPEVPRAGPIDGPPPVGGPMNNFRLSAKKKTYAQVPGLTNQTQQAPPIFDPTQTICSTQNIQGNILTPSQFPGTPNEDINIKQADSEIRRLSDQTQLLKTQPEIITVQNVHANIFNPAQYSGSNVCENINNTPTQSTNANICDPISITGTTNESLSRTQELPTQQSLFHSFPAITSIQNTQENILNTSHFSEGNIAAKNIEHNLYNPSNQNTIIKQMQSEETSQTQPALFAPTLQTSSAQNIDTNINNPIDFSVFNINKQDEYKNKHISTGTIINKQDSKSDTDKSECVDYLNQDVIEFSQDNVENSRAAPFLPIEDNSQNAHDGFIWTDIANFRSDVIFESTPAIFSSENQVIAPPLKFDITGRRISDVNNTTLPPSIARKHSGQTNILASHSTPSFFVPAANNCDLTQQPTLTDSVSSEAQQNGNNTFTNVTQGIPPVAAFSPPSQNIGAIKPPTTKTIEDICKPVPIEIKPPSYDPPKNLSNTNFRLNKKRPQYFSGPIAGGIATASGKPQAVFDQQPSLPSTTAFYNPANVVETTPSASETLYSYSASQEQTDSSYIPPLNQPQVPATSSVLTPNLPPFMNASAAQVLPSMHNVQFSNDSPFIRENSPTYLSSQYTHEDDSKSNIFGALKSKLGAVDLNKIQSAVTSFFDPNYFGSNPNPNESSTHISNLNQNFYSPDNTQNVERFYAYDQNSNQADLHVYNANVYSNIDYRNFNIENQPINVPLVQTSTKPPDFNSNSSQSHMPASNTVNPDIPALGYMQNPTNFNEAMSFKQPEVHETRDSFADNSARTYENMPQCELGTLSASNAQDALQVQPDKELQSEKLHKPLTENRHFGFFNKEANDFDLGSNNESINKLSSHTITYSKCLNLFGESVAQFNKDSFKFSHADAEKDELNFNTEAETQETLHCFPIDDTHGSTANEKFSCRRVSESESITKELSPVSFQTEGSVIPIPGRTKKISEDELILETTQRPLSQLNSYPSGPSESGQHFPSELKEVEKLIDSNPISFFDNFDAPSQMNLGANVRAAFEAKSRKQDITDKMIENITNPDHYIKPVELPKPDLNAIACDVILCPPEFQAASVITERNNYGFFLENDDPLKRIPANACDEVKAVLKSTTQDDEAKILPRQYEEPTAPVMDEDRSDSIDIQQIEADAKRDSLNCDETANEHSGTDDDKIESSRERSTELIQNPYTLFGSQALDLNQITTSEERHAKFATYFDTGDYASEDDVKTSNIYGYELSPDVHNNKISQNKIYEKCVDNIENNQSSQNINQNVSPTVGASNPLARYFMSSTSDDSFKTDSKPITTTNPEHAKQFFELSESQNHYKFAQNTLKVSSDIYSDDTSDYSIDAEVIAVSIVNSCEKCLGMMDSDGCGGNKGGDSVDSGIKNGKPKFKVDILPEDNSGAINEEKSADDGNPEVPIAVDPSQYRPQKHHWFYRSDVTGRSLWKPFSNLDNNALEEAFLNDTKTLVATNGGRYDVNLEQRTRHAVYWKETPTNVRRSSWFYKGGSDGSVVPYSEATAAILEEEYKNGITTGVWHRRISLPNGESVVLHGPTVMVHFPLSGTPSNVAQTMTRPRVVRRGFADFTIEEGESRTIDHLLLLVHGIGSACDLKFRPVEEVVDEFRTLCNQLTQAHYKSSIDQEHIGRIEVLPVSWHSTLHKGDDGVDKRMSLITLDSIPRLRSFTNDTILDVLLYTSPVFCQTIMDTVGEALNHLKELFSLRNPTFNGGISLGGHSLGSLILFDLLCHQNRDGSMFSAVNPKVGAAGTGQPFITYPKLTFHPDALFALGSPIGMFFCVRGVDGFGENFSLPTCPAFYNIFHPYDPIAYRIEPLINADLKDLPPYLIPHHKGRKRMHLELKETVTRLGADLRAKLFESLKSTWSSVFRPNMQQVIQEELTRTPSSSNSPQDTEKSSDQVEQELSKKLGKLNLGRRVDCVLQEAPFELINEYLSAVTSHLCYWESEDTMLLILREIYSNLGIQPDTTVPAQTLTVEVERTSPSPDPQPSSSSSK